MPRNAVSGRRRNAVWNLFFGYLFLGLALVRNILLVPVYLQFLSIAEFGAWSATGALVAQLFVTDAGLNAIVVQRTSAHLDGDPVKLGRIIGTGLLAGTLMALLLTGILATASPFIVDVVLADEVSDLPLAECFLLALLANCVGVVATIAGGVLTSLQHPVRAGLTLTVAELAGLIATIALLFDGFGLHALAYGLLLRSALYASGALANVLTVSRHQSGLALNFSTSEARGMLHNSMYLLANTFSMRTLNRMDVFFVGAIIGPSAAGIYTVSLRALDTIKLFIGRFSHALSPSMANLFATGTPDQKRSAIERVFDISFSLAGLAVAGYVALNGVFVALWLSPSEYVGDVTTTLLGIAMLAIAAGGIPYSVLMAQGEYGTIARILMPATAIHVILIVLFLPLGTWIAPAVTIITTIAWSLAMTRAVTRTTGDTGVGASLLKRIPGKLAAATVAGAVTAILAIRVDSWLAFGAAGVTCAACFSACLFILDRRTFNLFRREARVSSGSTSR